MTKDTATARYLSAPGAQAYQSKYDRNLARRLDNRRETEIMRQLLDAAQPRQRALVAACGAGRFGSLILDRVDQAVFTDLSPAMLELAKGTLTRYGSKVTFQVADATQLPFPDRSFDGVIAIRLVHHIQDPARARHCVHELLRVPRHWAIITFAAADCFKSRYRAWRRRGTRRGNPEATLSRSQVQELAAAAGFQVERFAAVSRLFSTQTYALLRRTNA